MNVRIILEDSFYEEKRARNELKNFFERILYKGRQLHKHADFNLVKRQLSLPGNVVLLEAGDCTLEWHFLKSAECAL